MVCVRDQYEYRGTYFKFTVENISVSFGPVLTLIQRDTPNQVAKYHVTSIFSPWIDGFLNHWQKKFVKLFDLCLKISPINPGNRF